MSSNPLDINILRRKTTMVVVELERALGGYKKEELTEYDSSNYIDSRRGPANQHTLYLDDYFTRIIKITKDTDHHEQILKLYNLARELDLWTIRSACAHPNTKFFPDYWYKVATLASNQIFSQLGLESVTSSLAQAESGSLIDPPDDWAEKYQVLVPNNLPDKRDYEITNLIGREKELKNLEDHLRAQRTNNLAIVAPGGIGKTALALCLLDRISHDSSSSSWVDGIVYVSMKIDQLTADGIFKLNSQYDKQNTSSDTVISELQKALLEGFCAAFDDDIDDFINVVNKYESYRLIICLDNFETLILDNPDAVDGLLEQMPITWKVILTSRVSINDAKHIPLGELKPKSAQHLARRYLTVKNGPSLSEEEVADLAKRCLCNPLSIRLTIDLLILGETLPNALGAAENLIADFSFNNLIDRLSDDAVSVLDLLTTEGRSSKVDLMQSLNLSREAISEAMRELLRTSLLHRVSDDNQYEEQWEASGAISTFARVNPRMIQARQALLKKAATEADRARSIETNQKKRHPWYSQYIDPKHEDSFKSLLFNINREIASREKAEKVHKLNGFLIELEAKKHLYADKSEYWIKCGEIYRQLLLNKNMIDCFEHALSCTDISDYLKLRMAICSRHAKEREMVIKLLKPIMSRHKSENTKDPERSFVPTVYETYFIAMLALERWNQVIEETDNWEDSEEGRNVEAAFRALSYQRLSERNTTPEKKREYLINAIEILDSSFRNDGYARVVNWAAERVIKELRYCLVSAPYANEFSSQAGDLKQKTVWFCDSHLEGIHDFGSSNEIRETILDLAEIETDPNPFISEKWKKYIDYVFETGITPDEINDTSIIATVKRRPEQFIDGTHRQYLFARDESGKEYYISKDLVNSNDWNVIPSGCQLVIDDFDPIPQQGKKSLTAKKVTLVNRVS